MGFLDDITGKTAEKAIQQKGIADQAAYKQFGTTSRNAFNNLADQQAIGQQAIVDSYDNAQGTLQTGFNSALDYFQPYIDGGQGASQRYNDALGVNGYDAQSQFINEEQSSPAFQAGLSAGVDDLMSRFAATNTGRVEADGLPRSGRVLKSLQGFGNRYLSDHINDRLTHLNTLNGQGFNASQGAANLTTNYANNQGNIDLGRGQAVNQSYALPASTRQQGQLTQAQANLNGALGFNNGNAQGDIAGANGINNLVTQGLNFASSIPFGKLF